MNRVFGRLAADDDLVTNERRLCPICMERFLPGQRITLQRITLLGPNCAFVSTVPAAPVHATCGLRGVRMTFGEVEYIDDVDGMVHCIDGRTCTLEEAGF